MNKKQLKDKFNIKFKKDNTICYIILILVALFICVPFIKNGFIITHDGDAHFSRNFATIQGIKTNQFLPAIVSNFCSGFGYSWNLFYPPLSTYINAFFYLIVQNYVIAMKLTIIFSVIFSGVFSFKFMQNVTKNKDISLIVSLLYITSTYFLVDIYLRLAIGEIMTFVFLPILFYGLYNIFYEKGKKNYLLTIGAVGILLSHNISSLIVVVLSIIFILIHMKKLWKDENSIQIWKNLSLNAFFIILIVSFFHVPLLEHKFSAEYIAMTKDGMATNEFVAAQAINLHQLVATLPILIFLLLTPICYKKVKEDKRLLYLSTLIIGIIMSFMATKWFPWKDMPSIFNLIQFPWRMLLFSTFLLGIIAGVNISKCIGNIGFSKLFIIILVILINSVICISSVIRFNDNYDISYLYDTNKIENIYAFSQQCAGYEYLPVKARTPYIQDRGSGVIVLSGNAQIKNEQKEGNNMQFTIKNNLNESILELPYIYYLGYDIKLNGKEIKYKESENGFISVCIPKDEEGTINVKYSGTKLSKIATVTSIIGITGFIIYVVIEKRRHNGANIREIL